MILLYKLTEFDMNYSELRLENADLKKKLEASKLRLCNIKDDNKENSVLYRFSNLYQSFCLLQLLGAASCELFMLLGWFKYEYTEQKRQAGGKKQISATS